MIRTILIDDEQDAIQILKTMLNDFCPDVKVVAYTHEPDEGVLLINRYKPDLVFLDINMPVLNGFDVLDQLNFRDFKLIFVTAFETYALKAIKYSAFDYLLKPIDLEELCDTVKRFKNSHKQQLNDLSLKTLKENLAGVNSTRIIINSSKETTLVQVSDIVRCEASGNYTCIFLHDGNSIICSKPLKHYENLLASHGFIRVHRSHLVAKDEINIIKSSGAKNYEVHLNNGTEIPVANNKYSMLKRLFQS